MVETVIRDFYTKLNLPDLACGHVQLKESPHVFGWEQLILMFSEVSVDMAYNLKCLFLLLLNSSKSNLWQTENKSVGIVSISLTLISGDGFIDKSSVIPILKECGYCVHLPMM